MSKAKHNIIPYNKIDLSRVSITDLEDNDRIPSQKISYLRYNHPQKGEAQWDIQSCEILLDNYGIPDGDGPYYKTAKQRAFVKVPLNVNDQVTNETVDERETRAKKLTNFKESLIAIDKYLDSEDMKIKLFGSAKKAKAYSYQPIVRQSKNVAEDDSDDSDAEEKEVVTRPDYMKGKIHLDYNTENVQVEIFQKNNDGSDSFQKDGSHTEISVTSLDDMRKHVAYMRKQRFVFHVSKLWASKQPANGQDKKMYGATLKLRRVEVQERTQLVTTDDNDDGVEPFIDSDDEDDGEVKLVKEFVTKDTTNEDSEEESEEENDESDESDEEEVEAKPPTPPPVKKGRKKASSKNL
tara:strand:- start:763 stop:1815 length:1053 start_codon:yes stop_codon:yes gene_type:complete